MAKSKEIKNKTDKELQNQLIEKREALRSFRFDISGSKTRNVKLGKGLRKQIAQMLTEVNSRTIAKK
jgi:ribosomal protein L29